ncbi:HoxN/HupN/NixA family nickel/cobalt transporter [Rhodococcus sp. Chr-9]|uniref:HoxN/HupN/NixA family nickel/cobalt transporter n=1 Tax=Rhodococcus sp. Chr-9 TaxID=713612 RepID=UPI000B0D04A4|nr:nickel transporter [Rhodococcus sp. Chr-9]
MSDYATSSRGSRLARLIDSSERERVPERLRIAATLAVVASVHVLGFGLLAWAQWTSAADAVGVGVALTAYALGLRHALDADHITGIDNATRKFVGEGRRPMSVGLAFSLGHSTVVFVVTALVAAGVGAATRLVSDDEPMTALLATVGAMVAGGFLVLIAAVNTVAWLRFWALYRERDPDATAVEVALSRTAVARVLQAPLRRVRYPRHIYVLGVLFGLGFDTAMTIGVVAAAVATTLTGVSVWLVLALPLCFAAGMTLVDALDGIAMTKLYSGEGLAPGTKIFFTLITTGVSVVAAAVLGTIILVSTAHEALELTDPWTGWVADLDLDYIGIALAATFAVLWIGAVVLTRQRCRCRVSRREQEVRVNR